MLVRGEGCYVEDDQGRRYLDLLGGLAVNALGHAHPAVVETLTRQAGRSPMCPTSSRHHRRWRWPSGCWRSWTAVTARCSSPNSGAEAEEAALKRPDSRDGLKIVVAEGGFHGRTTGALSLTSKAAYRIPSLRCCPGLSSSRTATGEALREAVNGETAAILLEPIQVQSNTRINEYVLLIIKS